MKILYHHRTASKDGQAVHIEEMIGALRSLGHEVRVVGPNNGKNNNMGAKVGWIHQLKAILPRAVYELMELTYSWIAYRHLVQAVREFQPDILYERYNLFMLAGVMIRRRFGVPLLLEVNAPLVHERSRFSGLALKRLARWTEGLVWRSADLVLPVTRVLAGYVAAYGVSADRIVVIPNGINEAHFAAAPSSDEAKNRLGLTGALVLGFTGFVRDWHGVDRVICWMATKDAPANVQLLIVGDGPARPELERIAAEYALDNRVIFTGVLPRERVPEYVAAFDIALQPAVVPYASPLKLFEYLVLGKAIIAPRQPNIEEVLVDGENALLFDSSAPDGLETALTRLLTDQRLCNHIAAGAKTTIGQRGLTWVSNALRIQILAKQVIEKMA